MKVAQLNMRHSPMVGELVVHFIQNVGISVLLVQDPPRTWLMKSQISDYYIFCPSGHG